jgi:cell division septal protein FtsQ
MTTRLPVRRTAGHARRPNGPKRRSAGLSPLRAAAALVVVLSALAIYGVGASSVFGYARLQIEDEDQLLVDPAAVQARLGTTSAGTNLFLVRTDGIEAVLRELPTVADAEVSVQLPDTLRVRLIERDPILVWIVGEQRFLVDRDGALFATYPVAAPGPSKGLPSVLDRRLGSAGLAVGSRLDPIDLDAATRLGSLTPSDVGSGKTSLRVTVDDTDGYTVQALPGGPVAVFGFYAASLRTPDMIPGQARLLRSLLTGREATVRRVVLAGEANGTYQLRPTPKPGASASPTPRP